MTAAHREETPLEAQPVETGSGKGAGDENFPVGSFLLPKHLRPHVAVFYAFARAADDIADNPSLEPDDKIQRLDLFEEGLTGAITDRPQLDKAYKLKASLEELGVTNRHGVDLLAAFKQDAQKSRYEDWADLMGYCELSANPVGRYLLDIHGESRDLYPASDALCSALQVINHLQDVQKDYRDMDRVYVPQDWLSTAGLTVESLNRASSDLALRRVLDKCLEGIDTLLDTSRALSRQMTSKSLAMETAAIQALAETLTKRLWRQDPLAVRVELKKPAFLWIAGCAALGEWRRRLMGKSPPTLQAAGHR